MLTAGVYDLEVEHHARVFVLKDVAVEEVELLAVEVVGELYGYAHRLPGPYENGVLPPQVGGCPALLVHRRLDHLVGAVPSLEHPEPEAVEVHGVGHASLLIADLPDLCRASLHYDRVLVWLVSQPIDEPPRLTRLRRRGERHRAQVSPLRVVQRHRRREGFWHRSAASDAILHHHPEHVELVPVAQLPSAFVHHLGMAHLVV